MAETLGSALLELGVNHRAFDRGMAQAERQTKELDRSFGRAGASISQRFDALGTRLTAFVSGPLSSLGVALGAGAVIGGLTRLVQHTTSVGDDLNRMNIQTGISVENLSALKVAAELNDTSLQDLGAALRIMNVNVAEAARGSGEAADVLKAMGFSVDDMRKAASDPEGFLQQFATQLFRVEDAGTRSELAFRVFGRQAQGLLPLFQDIAERGLGKMREESDRLNQTWSTDSAKAAAAFDDNLTRVRGTLEGLITRVGNYYIPRLNAFLDLLGLAEKAPIEQRAARVEELLAERKRLETMMGQSFIAIQPEGPGAKRLQERIAAINEELARTKREMVDMAKTELRPPTPTAPPLKIDLPTKGDRDRQTQAERDARADLEAFIRDSNARMTEMDQARVESLTRILGQTEGPLQQYTQALAEAEALLGQGLGREEFLRYQENLNNWLWQNSAAGQAHNEVQERYNQLLQEARDPQLEYVQRIKDAIDLYNQGRMTIEEYHRAILAGADRLPKLAKDTGDEARDATSALAELGATFTSAFEEAQFSGEGLSGVLQGLAEDVARIIQRVLILDPLMRALKDAMEGQSLSGLLSKGLGWLGGLLGGAAAGPAVLSGAGAAGPIAMAQHGAVVRGPTLLAEAGRPEAVLPLTRLASGDLGVYAGGGGQPVTVNVINNAPNTRATARERQTPQGKTIEVLVDELVAQKLASPSSASGRAMRTTYGASQGLIGR
jgi:hypothetical protein